MSIRVMSALVLAAGLGCAASASTFTEATDLPNSAPAFDFGTLAPGMVHTFSGTISGTCATSDDFSFDEAVGTLYFSNCLTFSGDFSDNFTFVAPDTGLASATLSVSGLTNSGASDGEYGELDGTGGLKSKGLSPFDSGNTFDILADGAGGLASIFSIKAESYLLQGYPSPVSAVGETVDFSWTLTATTNPEIQEPPAVPLPAGLLLGLTGLGALGLTRARRRPRS